MFLTLARTFEHSIERGSVQCLTQDAESLLRVSLLACGKTQLIRFGLSLSNTCNARIVFCGGEQLVFLNTVRNLGHHLSYNLSDDEDINRKCHDFIYSSLILNPALHLLALFVFPCTDVLYGI